MKYKIEIWGDLWCVFKWIPEEHGWRITASFETKEEAEQWIKERRTK